MKDKNTAVTANFVRELASELLENQGIESFNLQKQLIRLQSAIIEDSPDVLISAARMMFLLIPIVFTESKNSGQRVLFKDIYSFLRNALVDNNHADVLSILNLEYKKGVQKGVRSFVTCHLENARSAERKTPGTFAPSVAGYLEDAKKLGINAPGLIALSGMTREERKAISAYNKAKARSEPLLQPVS